ncbi:hypothetical protein N7539_006130 [Penicillium diatomitis]|uniref:Uncharacterized protein n=1 Tax=Penicillium diatomitis TaxID=2819901 RepID=A0A9W9X2K5_9EURO|nr:uncharacterized protein N7539_006130 [Penicillium diatomitis]KAJ5482684.1 hypothetical protein N7539_006130 [Penicillium diatomitis]
MPPATEDAIRAVAAMATTLGNKISVHMLNYLSTTQDLPDGFRELSHTFLDTCRTLWAIEAGITELTAANRSLPEIVVDEIEKKFVAAYRDFQQLDKVILKLVHWEHRGTLGKLQRGWSRPGHELNRIHESLKKNNETLQISGMAFHWSLKEAHPEEAVGIGYASLAAALDRISKGRSVMGIDKTKSVKSDDSASKLSTGSALSSPLVPPKEPRYPRGSSPSVPEEHEPSFVLQGPESMVDDMSSVLSLNEFLVSQPARDVKIPSAVEYRTLPMHPSQRSSAGSTANISLRGASEPDTGLRPREKPSMSTLNGYTMPHQFPHPTLPSGTPNPRNSLTFAIQERNYILLERLLTNGMSPDKHENIHPLNEAILHRDLESTQMLLQYKANPNVPDLHGNTPLYLAVEQSFVEGAALLLQHGADVNYRAQAELDSPLTSSIFRNNPSLVQSLLAYGGKPNEETRNDTTLLIDAIRNGASQQIITILLDAGCHPDLKDKHGRTALCEAVLKDQPALITSLLDHHANPNLPGPEHALWSAVHRPDCLRILLARGADIKKAPGLMEQATSVNNINAVRVLLQAGVDPNLKKDGVYTPLCSAIRDDRSDIVTLLLSHGADPNVMASEYPAWKCISHDRLQYFPDLLAAGADLRKPPGIAESAVHFNHMKALQWVIEHGANPNDRNAEGFTALTTAIRDSRMEMIDWLLAHGADPNIRGEDWPIYMATQSSDVLRMILPAITNLSAHKGVMEKAVQAGSLESVKFLLAAGANVEWKNGGVFSPLTTALREHHFEIVRFLLNEAGADPNAPGEHLPLVKAIRRRKGDDFSMIELLIDKGADPNKCYREWNAIMQAIENRDLPLLRILINRGGPVDFTQRDETGQTVLEMAESSGWPEGAELLVQNSQ